MKKTTLCYLQFYSVFYIVHFNVYSMFINMNIHCVYKQELFTTICTIKIFCGKNETTVLIVSKQLDSHPLPKVKENINRNCYRQQQAVKTHAACTRAALREIVIHGRRIKQSRQGYQWDKNSHCRQGEKHSGRKRIMINLLYKFKIQWVFQPLCSYGSFLHLVGSC